MEGMTQLRHAAGTPAGGRFAPSAHAEASASLGPTIAEQVYEDLSMVPLPELREQTMASIAGALEALSDPRISEARSADPMFPHSAFDEAVHLLDRMHSEMDGGAPMTPARSGVEAAMVAYRDRQTSSTGTVPLAAVRASTAAQVDAAVALVADSPVVRECQDADAQFPAEVFSRATQALRSVQQQVAVVAVVMTPDQHGRRSAELRSNPAFAAYLPYSAG